MSWGEPSFAMPELKRRVDVPVRRGRDNGVAPAEKGILILDMGEASREEGFRLNGCR